eukprot:2232832-Pyramimonas_sp.AAC.1
MPSSSGSSCWPPFSMPTSGPLPPSSMPTSSGPLPPSSMPTSTGSVAAAAPFFFAVGEEQGGKTMKEE